VQQFKTRPDEKLSVRIGDAPPRIVAADTQGRITLTGILIPSKEGVRIRIERMHRP
jgi:hypothetical protein